VAAMKRLLLLSVLLCACVRTAPVISPVPDPLPPDYHPVAIVAVKPNPLLANVLAGLQAQMKLEMVMCLYGEIVNDTADIITIQPARIDSATTHSVYFNKCALSIKIGYGVQLRYLGTWHNHPNSTCDFSHADDFSFRVDPESVIDWMSCPELRERIKQLSPTKNHGT
jgi:hypothetical protein